MAYEGLTKDERLKGSKARTEKGWTLPVQLAVPDVRERTKTYLEEIQGAAKGDEEKKMEHRAEVHIGIVYLWEID